jgi:hypothetical protein
MKRIKSYYLTLGLLNVRSLNTGRDELAATLALYNPDIIALNETWLRQGEELFVPKIPGYVLKSNPRQDNSRGGGVGFYIRKGLRAQVRQHPPSPLEQMWLELNIRGKGRFAIGTAYRPESVSVDNAIDALNDSLDVFATCGSVFLLTDFNINLDIQDGLNTRKLTTFLAQRSLEQLVKEPTRVTKDTSSLLDLVITDCPHTCKAIYVHHNPSLSDHALILAELVFTKPKLAPQYIYKRLLGQIDQNQFNNDLINTHWGEITELDDINGKVNRFNQMLTNIFDKHAPVRRLRTDTLSYPWITDTIKNMMSLRDSALKRAQKTKKETHTNYYKNLRNYTTGALEREKNAYFTFYVNKNRYRPKQMWKHLKNSSCLGGTDKPTIPHHLFNPDEINKFFLTLPGSSGTDRETQASFEYEIPTERTFIIRPCTDNQILKIITAIKTNASGHDDITMEMIRLTLNVTLPVITHIINSSIALNIFPKAWKIARVKPIPKSNKTENYKDLRPISILPALSKIIEKVVSEQLTKYLEDNSVLPPTQSGFRGKHGTATALAKVTDDVIAAADKGMGSILVLLDFSRAFDCLNPSLLLSKMAYYGVSEPSCKWFQSFLTDRRQYVELQTDEGGVVRSKIENISRGTPQGSILSPLLFILYTADLVRNLKYCSVHLYADDTQLYYSFVPHDLDMSISKINEDLDVVAKWSLKNNLVLNPKKSQFIILGNKWQRNKIKEQDPKIKIGTESIVRVENAKNLGMTIDEELRYVEHINIKIRNAFYRLKVLYNIRKYVSEKIREILVESLVLSQLNYGDIVYGPRLLAKTKNSIQRVQNACVRFCYNVPKRAHITPFLNERNILNMSNRRHLHLAYTVRKIIELEKPQYLFHKLKWVEDTRGRVLRRSTKLVIPPHKTIFFRGGFKFAAAKIWNDLPPPLRERIPLFKFKQLVKGHLLGIQSKL